MYLRYSHFKLTARTVSLPLQDQRLFTWSVTLPVSSTYLLCNLGRVYTVFFHSRHIDPWLNICFSHYSSLLQYFSDFLLRHWGLHHSSSGSYSILNRVSSSSNYNCNFFSSGLTAKFYPLPGKLINNTIYVIKSCLCVLLLGSLAVLTVHYGQRNMEPVVTETTSISEYMQKSSHLSRHFPGTAGINSSIPQKNDQMMVTKIYFTSKYLTASTQPVSFYR